MGSTSMGRLYRISPRTKKFYRMAFFLVIAGLLLELFLVFLVPDDMNYAFEPSPMRLAAFGLLFVAVAALVCANVSLWFGMLYFIVQHDSSPMAERLVWFLISLFGMSFGAALYYWFVYRKLPEKTQRVAAVG